MKIVSESACTHKRRFDEKRNIAYLKSLSWVLLLSVFLDFINTILKVKFGMSSTTQITLSIYIVLLLAIYIQVFKYKGFTVKRVGIYLLVLLFFFLNYVLFENSRSYLSETNMMLVYFYYIPISIFVVAQIDNWSYASEIFQKFSYLSIILCSIGITLVDYSNSLNYMEFSYSILPFIVFIYYSFRRKPQLINFIAFLVGFANVLVFGARAPILFLILFIIMYEIIHFKARGKFTIVIFLILGSTVILTIFVFNDALTNLLMQFAESSNSRFLTKIFNNQLIESQGRDVIYSEANYALENMGLEIYGVFGDRQVVSAIYVHNIIYEFLLSFGYLLGSIFLLIILYLIVRTILLSKIEINKNMAMIFTVALFLRYFISGSFVIEGNFYIYIAIMLNLCSKTGEIVKNEKS